MVTPRAVVDKMSLSSSPPKIELWGTFSVKDHLRKRPFAAEVLVYDRLVMPRPPTSDEEPCGPGEQSEVTRWGVNNWKPGRLKKLLPILQENKLVIEVHGQSRRDRTGRTSTVDLPRRNLEPSEQHFLSSLRMQSRRQRRWRPMKPLSSRPVGRFIT